MRFVVEEYADVEGVEEAESLVGEAPGVWTNRGSYSGRETVKFWSKDEEALRSFLAERLHADFRYCEVEVVE